MLNFAFLFDLLIIYLAILIFVQIIKLFKPGIRITMGERGTILEEIGALDIKSRISEKGRATDVKLANDPMQEPVGTIMVSEGKGQIRIVSGTTDSITGNAEYKRVGFVDESGYIYKQKNKNVIPEPIGYLARPSKPNEPTLVGERTWKDLWYSRRLNAYYGLPSVIPADSAASDAVPGESAAKDAVPAEITEKKKGWRFRKKKDEPTEPQETNTDDASKKEEKPAGGENKHLEFNALAFFQKNEKLSENPAGESAVESEKRTEEESVKESAVETPDERNSEESVTEVNISDESILNTQEESMTEESLAVEEGIIEAEESKSEDEEKEEQQIQESYPSGDEKVYLDGLKGKIDDVLKVILEEMVKVPGGTFSMGADPETSGKAYPIDANEGPVHTVSLKPFYMGMYPVTQKYWRSIMGYNPSPKQDDTYPVAPVSWDDCVLFTQRLSYLTGMKFSLPTEAQWEYAAKGGSANQSYIYSGSDNRSKVAQSDPYKSVGLKMKNSLGLYDMSGLVREWCLDWYADRYPEEEQIDPEGPPMPEDSEKQRHVVRSLRGNESVTCRKGESSKSVEEKDFKSYGFRLVCNDVADKQSVLLGVHKAPELIGSARLCGYVDPTPSDTPITDEARGAAFSLFYGLAARKADYDEFLGESATSWRDTALISSLIYSALFLILYFVNTIIFRYPLLGNQMNAMVVMLAAYFLLWATVRFYKKERIENGHSIQAFLDIFNKSVGIKVLDIFIILAGALGFFLSYRYFDSDFVPLLFAIVFGSAVNLTIRPNAVPWKVNNPYKPAQVLDLQELDEDIERPEGSRDNKICEFDWDLDSFDNRSVHGHIVMGIDSEDIDNLRMDNPYFLEMPILYNNTTALKVYVKRMLAYLHDGSSPDRTLRLRYILQEIGKISDKNSLNELDRLQFVLDFVQEPNIRYKPDDECREDLACPDQYMRYPDETLYDHVGDCKSKSFLAANLYYLMGYNVLLLLSTSLQHAAVAIAMNRDLENYFGAMEQSIMEYKGVRYVFCETTNDNFKIGDLGESTSIEKYDIIIDLTHKEKDDEEE